MNVRSRKDAFLAKAFLMTVFGDDRWALEKVHLAFNNPLNCNLYLTKKGQEKLAQILFDITDGKLIASRELAWDGTEAGKSYGPASRSQGRSKMAGTPSKVGTGGRDFHEQQESGREPSKGSPEPEDGEHVRLSPKQQSQSEV